MILKKQFEYIDCAKIDVFYSVSHVEEFYKAQKNDNNGKNVEALNQIRDIITSYAKRGIILNPSPSRIIAKSESFDECLAIIRQFDTRYVVDQDGKTLYELNSKNVKDLQEEDSAVINNSNLSSEEIWKRPEVLAKLSNFNYYYKNYKNVMIKKQLSIYGLSVYRRINKFKLPEEFQLTHNCFKSGNYSFDLLEVVIEFLNNQLCSCGYHKDKNVKKTQSGIHDVSHIIYATYCNYFVTHDKGLIARANAIYFYLGLDTKAIDIDEIEKIK